MSSRMYGYDHAIVQLGSSGRACRWQTEDDNLNTYYSMPADLQAVAPVDDDSRCRSACMQDKAATVLSTTQTQVGASYGTGCRLSRQHRPRASGATRKSRTSLRLCAAVQLTSYSILGSASTVAMVLFQMRIRLMRQLRGGRGRNFWRVLHAYTRQVRQTRSY